MKVTPRLLQGKAGPLPLLAAGKQRLIAAPGDILHRLKPASMRVIKELSIHRLLLVLV